VALAAVLRVATLDVVLALFVAGAANP